MARCLIRTRTRRLIRANGAPYPPSYPIWSVVGSAQYKRAWPWFRGMLSKTLFHPSVTAWFEERFKDPTPAHAEAWPPIQAGRNVLIAAPTGSGKTLAAFLAAIDHLVRQGVDGRLKDETQILYVSPLKALS